LWRGLPLPLVSISIVRTISFTIYSETKALVERFKTGWEHVNDATMSSRPVSPTVLSVALASSIAGAASGSVVSLGSAPFELVKVRRQLEYQIERDKRVRSIRLAGGTGPGSLGNSILASKTEKELMANFKPPGTWAAVKDIHSRYGPKGLWSGFKLHMLRDTLGTTLYFAEYDALRFVLGRDPKTGLQGKVPEWARHLGIREGTVAFAAGAFAGVTSW
jgi:solute carrier family 25 carnitine/acylcarnitine transporter 20/29